MKKNRLAWLACLALAASACSNEPKDPRPAGPESIAIPAVSYSSAAADVDKGKELFSAKGCAGCHKIGGGKLVGPDLKGVTARRNPRWIARMILHPEVMVKEDDTAKDLLKTHFTPMPNQNVSPASELPAILAYLHANES